MSHTTLIRKASGEKEPFSNRKFEESLKRAGADSETIAGISNEIENWLQEGVSTRKIYKKAFGLLRKERHGLAARYKLKKAIMELGPTGYPFEHFVGQLLRHYGYETHVGQILEGQCVQHEVDVVATANNKQIFVECKFYNSQGKYGSVRVPLYIRSRVDDIIKKRQTLPEFKDMTFKGWVVTNTRFTSDALDYGKCSGLHMVSWDYPRGHSLKDMIENEGFFPVTALTSLNKSQIQVLLDNGTVLCRQICTEPRLLDKVELKPAKKQKVLDEINELCRSAGHDHD